LHFTAGWRTLAALMLRRISKVKLLKTLLWSGSLGVIGLTACSTFPGAKVDADVTYDSAHHLKLDIYQPVAAPTVPSPVVVYIHGGGWELGDKGMVAMITGPDELLHRGYTVVSIDYRLAPKHRFPAMLDDAKSALRFLHDSAVQYHLDLNRVGVMGDSAGAHIAALLALTQAPGEAIHVRAVVDLYGPTDFTGGSSNADPRTVKLLQDTFGATGADDPVLGRVSPVTYVTSNAPPFLILHGNRDKMVDLRQSMELDARLRAAGVDSTLIIVTNFAHGYAPWGRKTTPDFPVRTRLIADFFDRTLK
jgi:acetyl esterase/lipase